MELSSVFWWKCKFYWIKKVLNKRNTVHGFFQGCPRVKQMKIKNWCMITIHVEIFKGVVFFKVIGPHRKSKTNLPHPSLFFPPLPMMPKERVKHPNVWILPTNQTMVWRLRQHSRLQFCWHNICWSRWPVFHQPPSQMWPSAEPT